MCLLLMMKKSFLVFSFCLLVFFCACHNSQLPDGVMTPSAMEAFLKEAYLLEGFYSVETEFRYDSLHAEMVASYDSLLAKHNITREDFERSVDYYTHHPMDYAKIHERVIALLDSTMATLD